ncbi:hypothetical protein J1N35_027531 [Gossypium stocksii]|uniref:AMP-dependent synthetase/ligase domain-containing protein n=1 Tax=Gossypium stocksii TaxID=47602 RepID=A0A9D3VBL2_9ROSI|nr:hypothetical protein J1N35_027531 [Gossypium stocksii]
MGASKQFDLPEKAKSDICTITYTSGTAGDPKGVMISNCSIVTLIAGVKHLVESVNEGLAEKDVYLSYLPLAHIFDRVIEEFFISGGALIGFWSGDVKLLVDDIGELKSSIFFVLSKVIKDFIVISSTQVLASRSPKRKSVNYLNLIHTCNLLRSGFMGTALSPSLLLLLTPRSKHLKAGLPRMVYMVALIPSVKIPRPKEYVVEELSKIGKEKKLKGFEFIKAAHIDPVPFDMERDLLTPMYKKKRSQLLKYYQIHLRGKQNNLRMQSVINNMYKSANKPNA